MNDAAFPCLSCGSPTYAGAPCHACGQSPTVCGEYDVVGLLGAGGMGLVYESRRRSDGARVAVKVLRLGDGAGWEERALFTSSCKVLAGLSHPGLPRVHAFEEDESGRLILVREVFDGGTLEERIRAQERRLDAGQLRTLMRELLVLAMYLHELVPAVVHRDIKPSNVMFRGPQDWRPVLVDFDSVAPPPARRTGLTVVGTLGYAAPEQLYGDASASSDLYGIGATLLFVATHLDVGELPRDQGRWDIDTLAPEVPPQARAVLRKLVEPERARRYQSARDALADLDRASPVALHGATQYGATQASPPTGRPPAPQKKPSVLGLVIAGILAVAIVGGGVGMLFTGRGIKDRRQDLAVMAAQSSGATLASSATQAAADDGGASNQCWILSEPKGACIFVGDQLLGHTPARLAVAGLRVRLELSGRKKFQGEARCGELVFLAESTVPGAPPPAAAPPPAVSPSAEQARVRVGSSPIGADVSVDGQAKGRTPIVLEVSLGTHVITVRHGAVIQTRTVNAIQDTDLFIAF